jgi:threonine/homoserine/homoserine lactone efflux protein
MGLATGLGAATADGIYATLGAMGMTVLISQLTALALPLSLAGSLFLAWMALGMLRRSVRLEVAAGGNVAASLLRAYASTLALTLGNPMTILSFIAVFPVCPAMPCPEWQRPG